MGFSIKLLLAAFIFFASASFLFHWYQQFIWIENACTTDIREIPCEKQILVSVSLLVLHLVAGIMAGCLLCKLNKQEDVGYEPVVV